MQAVRAALEAIQEESSPDRVAGLLEAAIPASQPERRRFLEGLAIFLIAALAGLVIDPKDL